MASQINTGGTDGLYHNRFCPLLSGQLAKAQIKYQCVQSAGSRENIYRVLSNPRQVGFAQLDVYAMETSKPGVSGALSIARADDVRECLFLVTRKKDIDNFGDIAAYADKLRFILPPKDSGSSATFEFLQRIDPEGLGRANQVTYASSTQEAVQQALSAEDTVSLFVQFPDPASPIFKTIAAADGQMIPVIDRNVLRQQIGNEKVYFAEETEVAQPKWVKASEKVITACTPLVVFTGNPDRIDDAKVRQDQADVIATIKTMQEAALVPQEGFFARMLKRTKQVSAQSAEKIMDMSTKAREKLGPTMERAREMGAKAKEAASEAMEKAKEAGSQAMDKAKEAAEKAAERAKEATGTTPPKNQ
jgi:hypothetical protein